MNHARRTRSRTFRWIILLVVAISLLLPCNDLIAAKKTAISHKKLSITVGSSKKIKILNINKKQKVTWSSDNKKIAVVNKSGKITAKKAGKVNIKAKVAKKTFTCKVQVKKKSVKKPAVEHKTVQIEAGNKQFKMVMYDNEAANAFVKLLPLTISMKELNGNEKYYYLKNSLPQESSNVKTIKTGDFMLYGGNCLVLFYEDFKTDYSYTKLGYVENTSELADTLGNGNINITFR